MDDTYEGRLKYLTNYAEVTVLDFITLWESAADVTSREEASEEEIQAVALRLISGMLDRGVQVGDSIAEFPGFVAWTTSKEETLARVADEMSKLDDPYEYLNICWFAVPLEEMRRNRVARGYE